MQLLNNFKLDHFYFFGKLLYEIEYSQLNKNPLDRLNGKIKSRHKTTGSTHYGSPK